MAVIATCDLVLKRSRKRSRCAENWHAHNQRGWLTSPVVRDLPVITTPF